MSEDISTQFRKEGDPAFPVDTENANSADPSSGKETTTDQTPSPGGEQTPAEKKDGSDETNFADHPRWRERESDWTKRFNEQEKRHLGEITTLREDIEGLRSKNPVAASVEVPSWFGGDEEQWREFQAWNDNLKKQVREETISEITSKTQAEQKAITDATAYFEDEVKAIEADREMNPQGETIDRNRILKTAMDFDLVDSKQRWNYRAAFLFMRNQATKARNSVIDEKREIAGATVSENRGEPKPETYATSETFKKPGARPW